MNKYYEVIGVHEGVHEVLYSSFVRADCVYELDAERDGWLGEGYRRLSIVAKEVAEAPDSEVYSAEELLEAGYVKPAIKQTEEHAHAGVAGEHTIYVNDISSHWVSDGCVKDAASAYAVAEAWLDTYRGSVGEQVSTITVEGECHSFEFSVDYTSPCMMDISGRFVVSGREAGEEDVLRTIEASNHAEARQLYIDDVLAVEEHHEESEDYFINFVATLESFINNQHMQNHEKSL